MPRTSRQFYFYLIPYTVVFYFAEITMRELQKAIGIAGLPASGKGTIRKILEIIFGDRFCAITTGMILRQIAHTENYPEPDSMATLQKIFSEKKAVLGDEWLHEYIKKAWSGASAEIGGLDGVRMPWDVTFIKSYPQWIVFYASAPDEVRHQRAVIRAKAGDLEGKSDEKDISLEAFLAREQHETARFTRTIKNIPGVTAIENISPRQLVQDAILALLNTRFITPADITDEKKQKLRELIEEIEKPESR